jgi:hypothetical protein
MKDFYDVWIRSNHIDFNADALLKGIDSTTKNRETPVPADDMKKQPKKSATIGV